MLLLPKWNTEPFEVSYSYLDTRYDSFGRLISPSQRPLPTQDNTTQKLKDKRPWLKRVRTHDLRNQGAKTNALDRAATWTGNIEH
jgi:hypothetical protein